MGGSFKTPTADVNVGGGSHTAGNFLSLSGTRTDRFLDPPEFKALHDTGNQLSFFDRLDAHTGDTGTFHLNVQAARSAFDVPNTVDGDALGQAQHQQIDTFNVAPGYSQVIGSKTLFTANAFIRQDHLTYSPSPDPLADQPGTVTQDRKLTNLGIKADVAVSQHLSRNRWQRAAPSVQMLDVALNAVLRELGQTPASPADLAPVIAA